MQPANTMKIASDLCFKTWIQRCSKHLGLVFFAAVRPSTGGAPSGRPRWVPSRLELLFPQQSARWPASSKRCISSSSSTSNTNSNSTSTTTTTATATATTTHQQQRRRPQQQHHYQYTVSIVAQGAPQCAARLRLLPWIVSGSSSLGRPMPALSVNRAAQREADVLVADGQAGPSSTWVVLEARRPHRPWVVKVKVQLVNMGPTIQDWTTCMSRRLLQG